MKLVETPDECGSSAVAGRHFGCTSPLQRGFARHIRRPQTCVALSMNRSPGAVKRGSAYIDLE